MPRSVVCRYRTAAVAAALLMLVVPASAVARSPQRALLNAVRLQVNAGARRATQAPVTVSQTRFFGRWVYGEAIIPPPAKVEGAGVPLTFIAHLSRGRWEVGLQGTKTFRSLLASSPRALVPANVMSVNLAPAALLPGGAGGGGPSLSLPWGVGQTWRMLQGPHNTNGAKYRGRSLPHPWNSLDFAGGDGVVRAAADGVVYRPCPNLVIVDHGNGWETGYYHLPSRSIPVRDGQLVRRGDVLGHTGTATGCGGYAFGDHVHFSIYHFASNVGIHTPAVWRLPTDDIGAIGEVLGGWLIQNGSEGGGGCMQRTRDGLRQCAPSASIRNEGVAGDGGAPSAGNPPMPGGTPDPCASPAQGNAALGRFSIDGSLTTTAVRALNPGWTTVLAEPANGLEFFYNRSTGTAASVRFSDCGQPTTTWSGTMSAGWSSIEATNNGLVLFYNAASGLTAPVAFNSAGQPSDLATYSLNAGWTTVTALSGGVQLFYNQATGVGAVGTIDAAGAYHQIEAQMLSPGWATITQGPNGLELFYNPDGTYAAGRWNGQTIETLSSSKISNGWSSITPIAAGHTAFYNRTSGLMLVANINATGAITTLASYPISPGWTNLAALPGGLELFYRG